MIMSKWHTLYRQHLGAFRIHSSSCCRGIVNAHYGHRWHNADLYWQAYSSTTTATAVARAAGSSSEWPARERTAPSREIGRSHMHTEEEEEGEDEKTSCERNQQLPDVSKSSNCLMGQRGMRKRKRVVVGLSGGVDSSIAAYLLKKQGLDVIGVHMTNWDAREEQGIIPPVSSLTNKQQHILLKRATAAGACSSAERDVRDAENVARALGIPFHRVDFTPDYWSLVFEQTVSGYEKGVTPNPDVLCNRHIKFDVFLKHACERFKADAIATGHYARVKQVSSWKHSDKEDKSPFFNTDADDAGLLKTGFHMMTAADTGKDQTYFLSRIPSSALPRVMFPLGGWKKNDVRALARQINLGIADKKESMGLCFVGKRKFAPFLQQYTSVPLPATVVSCLQSTNAASREECGDVIGHVRDATALTIGQNIALPGMSHKWYVCAKDLLKGVVTVAPSNDHRSLYASSARATNMAWLCDTSELRVSDSGSASFPCLARLRHGAHLVSCTVRDVTKVPEFGKHSSVGARETSSIVRWQDVLVRFREPQRAISPGQVIAFYVETEKRTSANADAREMDGDSIPLRVLGGGELAEVGTGIQPVGQ